jgi:HEAT repeat protein
MFARISWIACLTVTMLSMCAIPCAIADEETDKAFDALKTYDWGQDRKLLSAIDQAVAATHKDAAAQKELATRLSAVLKTDAAGAAKDFVCRKLSLIGSAESVPALAGLLSDKKLSHMARYALERMPCPEAVAALRDAVAKTSGRTKVGVINSLGVRRDAQCTEALVALLKDSDKELAAAAAAALGNIGTPEAAEALKTFQAKAPKELNLAAADAYLTCAEKLLADGKKTQAMLIYNALKKSDHKHVRVAAMLGLLAATGKKKK